ncbi:Uncharacterised protein [Mycobacteroides abscessus subsp. abscessus]|nr:Uncharacterised protein [Mycobacteroides abscessus subsp. abscessus]
MLYTEKGVAPQCNTAVSHRWNSGRFVSISATVSPGPTPNPARPKAISRTRSRYRRHVITTPSPTVRSATRSGCCAAVRWNAAQSVAGPVTGWPGGMP